MKLLLTFLFAILAVGVLVSGFVNGVSAQTLCANGRVVAPCEKIDSTVQASLSNDKGFSLGQSLADCLIAECPIYIGVIETVDVDKEKDVVHIDLQVSQRLSGDAADDLDELKFDISLHDKDGKFEYDAFDVRLEPGNELMVGKTPFRNEAMFILRNANYFSSVRSTIIFNGANDLRKNFASVLSPLKDQSDNVLAGYVEVKSSTLLTVENMDEYLTVLQKLFADPKILSQNLPWIGETIDRILHQEGEHPSEASRDETVEKLLEIVTSNDKQCADRAVWVLENIADKNWFQPKKYLSRSDAEKLIQIIHKTMGADGFNPLVEKLSKIN